MSSYGITPTTHCDSGWLDRRSGGSRSSTKSNVSCGDFLHVDYMESESHGDKCKGHSHSKLEAGWILKGSPAEVTWAHMESDDDDACCNRKHAGDQRSLIVGLTFGGRPVTITGRQNQTLTIPGQATLILNEVHHDSDDDCDHDDEEHHALHLILKNGDEVILACAKFHSDDHCCNTTPTHNSSWGSVKTHYR